MDGPVASGVLCCTFSLYTGCAESYWPPVVTKDKGRAFIESHRRIASSCGIEALKSCIYEMVFSLIWPGRTLTNLNLAEPFF